MAKAKGISGKELGTALSIAMAVSGCRVRAQYKEVRARVLARVDDGEGGDPATE